MLVILSVRQLWDSFILTLVNFKYNSDICPGGELQSRKEKVRSEEEARGTAA